MGLDLGYEKKRAGILVPVFAIRHEEDLGIGDVEGMRQLIHWAAEAGLSVVQILPINETGNDNSPYNAISSMAIEPTTIDCRPDSVPGLTRETHTAITSQHDLEALREGSVQHDEVRKLKFELLRAAFHRRKQLPADEKEAFSRFRQEQHDWLADYSFFRTMMERQGESELWDQWPAEVRNITALHSWASSLTGKERTSLLESLTFWQFVQWVAWTQWGDLREEAARKGVGIMGDMPFGVSYYSADVFSQPHLFDLDWSGGAPPEPYFKDDPFTQKWGQNWGIPLYRWDRMEEEDFAWWRRRLRGVRSHAHICRIDHVLGFYRIYGFPWRPQFNDDFLSLTNDQAAARTGGRLPGFHPRSDQNPADAEANRREGEHYLKALIEGAEDCVLVGEDLGMVPNYVRPNLLSLGIAGFKIPMWESGQDGRVAQGANYPDVSVATYSTHDHSPMKQLWDSAKSGDGEANNNVNRLLDFAHRQDLHGRGFDEEVHHALLKALAASNAWLVIYQITDLFGTAQRFNTPGAVSGTNWSERVRYTVDEIAHDPRIQELVELLRGWFAETERTMPTAATK